MYMHSRLAEDVIRELDQETNEQIVFLGAQGPDPLSYHVLHKSRAQYRSYANAMHATNTRDLLRNLVHYTKQHQTIETYSFLIGFLCHYALDVTMHPYVFYHSGVWNPNKPETRKYRGLHLRFERSMDAKLIEQETNKKARLFQMRAKYIPVKHSKEAINKQMGDVINKAFQIKDGEEIYSSSVKAMYNVVRYFNTDRFGVKKAIFRVIDVFHRNNHLYMRDLSFFHRDLSYDFLNANHNTWYHPVTNEPHNESVMELYDQGKNFAIDLISKINMYLMGNKRIQLDQVFTNRSLNTGLDCDQTNPIQYVHHYLTDKRDT